MIGYFLFFTTGFILGALIPVYHQLIDILIDTIAGRTAAGGSAAKYKRGSR